VTRRLLDTFIRPWDFRLALATFGLVLGLCESYAKLRQSPHLLDVSAAVGIAVLTVVLALYAVLASFLGRDRYAGVLGDTKLGIEGAFRPYAVIAAVSGLTTGVSIAGLFLWPVAPPWAKSLLLASALGFSVWAIVGTVELVGITSTHGRYQARVPELKQQERKRAAG
jgi:hypothetical protein